MRSLAIIIGVLVAFVTVLVVLRRPSAAERERSANASATLRRAVLSREMFGAAPPGTGAIRAVAYDWRVGSGGVTIVAFADGTTSLYFTTGGGILGTGARESVQRAAAAMRAEAERVVSGFESVSDFPLPAGGQSAFYIVTDSATLGSGPIASSELERGKHPLSALAQRAQDVLTEIRRAS